MSNLISIAPPSWGRFSQPDVRDIILDEIFNGLRDKGKFGKNINPSTLATCSLKQYFSITEGGEYDITPSMRMYFDMGTATHEIIEKVVSFSKRWDFIETEATIIVNIADDIKFSSRFDILLGIDGQTVLIDIKSGYQYKKEHALQVGLYAQFLQPDYMFLLYVDRSIGGVQTGLPRIKLEVVPDEYLIKGKLVLADMVLALEQQELPSLNVNTKYCNTCPFADICPKETNTQRDLDELLNKADEIISKWNMQQS